MIKSPRTLNRLGVLGLSLLALGVGLGGTAVGCGDSSNGNQGTPGADASGGGEGGSQDDASANGDSATNGPTIDIVVQSITVYAGQRAQMLATQSKASNGDPLSFGWAVKSVPQGSTITNSSIQGGDALVSFVPDKAGDYVFTVTAQAASTTATKDVTVTAKNAPLFYVRTTTGTHIDDLGYEMRTVQMNGDGDHAVACQQASMRGIPSELVGDGGFLNLNDDAGDGGGAQMLAMANYMLLAMFSDQALDWWEAPADQPSHAAFQNITILPDGGPDAATTQVDLFIATQENTCQNQPFAARSVKGKSGDGMYNPKFSPDGRRVAFIERTGTTAKLVTTAIDGSDARVISDVCEDGKDECFSAKWLFPRRPQWIDETHVGWMRTTTTTDTSVGWEIMVAADISSAPVSRYLTCSSGTAPLLFNFLRDGNILINASSTKKGPENLLVLGRNVAGSCVVVKNLTNLTTDGSYARDFAISPDGTQVAYLQKVAPANYDGGSLEIRQGGELWMVPLDGSKAPAPIGPVPRGANYGPRWIAGGTRLAWNGMAPPPPGYDAGLPGELTEAGADGAVGNFFEAGLPAITTMLPDGNEYQVVAFGDPANGSYVLGGGNGGSCTLECNSLGCSPQSQCDPKSTCNNTQTKNGHGPAMWATMFAGVFFLRRSRKRRR